MNSAPRDGEILESEVSHLGHLQTTEMADLTSPGAVEANNFGPRSLTGSP